jgi:hypothetical protein
MEDADLCGTGEREREVAGRTKGTLLSRTIRLQGFCRQSTGEGYPK